jgi:hypothetical protein
MDLSIVSLLCPSFLRLFLVENLTYIGFHYPQIVRNRENACHALSPDIDHVLTSFTIHNSFERDISALNNDSNWQLETPSEYFWSAG